MENVKIYRAKARLKDIDLFYLDTKTEKPAILCLHGRWGRAETWDAFIRHYGDRYRIIAPDQRGHGLSSRPASKYTAEEMAEDMIGLLDSLQIESAIVVGHSMGGRIAGFLAAQHPKRVKAVAILDKSARGPEKPAEMLPGTDPLTKDWPLPFATRREAMDFIRKEMDTDLAYEYFMNSLYETEAGFEMRFSAQAMAANTANDEDWFHLLPRIQCLTLLVRARGSGAVKDEDFAKMQEMIPNCMAFEASNADHNVMLSNPEEFYGYFGMFLTRIGLNGQTDLT